MKLFVSFFISALLVFGCKCENENNINELKIKKEITEVFKNSEDGWNEGNWEKYMSSYLRSDSIRFVGRGNCTYGWETVLANYKKGYPDKSAMGKLTFSDFKITLLSGNYAILFGKWELERAEDHPWGLYTLVWEKTREGWKIIHDHTSSAD